MGFGFVLSAWDVAFQRSVRDLRRYSPACRNTAVLTFAASLDIACQSLGFLDGNVRVGDKADQIVRGVSPHQTLARPMIRQSDLMYNPAINSQRLQPIGNQHSCLDFAPCCT